MVSTPEVIVFLRILVAHIFADFFLQRTKWIAGKQNGARSVYLYYHVAIVGILTYLFLGDWTQWQLPLFIMVTHYLIDIWKSSRDGETRYFVIDQILHISMLIIGWAWYIGLEFDTIHQFWTGMNNTTFWIVLSSYLLVLRPVGFYIEKLTSKWSEELDDLQERFYGLNDAGTWIGYLERFIILTFILIGQYSAIGFLITAKSIFRFTGKVTDERDRKHTEYILIGTLISFTLAILVGIVARALMH